MNAAQTAVAVLFNDQNLSIEATYIPLNGQNKQVRIITRAPDVYQNIGQSVIETPTYLLEVQVADCPNLLEGDQFLIGVNTYRLQGVPRRDFERLVWQADSYEV
jgi:hypothetical protein